MVYPVKDGDRKRRRYKKTVMNSPEGTGTVMAHPSLGSGGHDFRRKTHCDGNLT